MDLIQNLWVAVNVKQQELAVHITQGKREYAIEACQTIDSPLCIHNFGEPEYLPFYAENCC